MPYTMKYEVNTRYTRREALIQKLQNIFSNSRESDFDVKVKRPDDLLAFVTRDFADRWPQTDDQ